MYQVKFHKEMQEFMFPIPLDFIMQYWVIALVYVNIMSIIEVIIFLHIIFTVLLLCHPYT